MNSEEVRSDRSKCHAMQWYNPSASHYYRRRKCQIITVNWLHVLSSD